MGHSDWNDDFYKHREADRAATGRSAFAYDADVTAGRARREVHAKMNPLDVMREARDSEAHPESLAIMVMFDVTGSMHQVPVVLQKKLPTLNGLLTDKGYVEHPAVLMGAVGDKTCDSASLQVGQFESGIEMDDDLERMFLEGGGGGSFEESYQNAIYFAARHTSIDCFEKREKKGYLFLMGDEMPYPNVSKDQIKALCGEELQADIPIKEIVEEAQRKYHVFFIIPAGTSHAGDPRLIERWEGIVGADHVLQLDSPDLVCETIAVTIGVTEGTVGVDTARAHLIENKTSERDADIIMRAVSSVAKEANAGGKQGAKNKRL